MPHPLYIDKCSIDVAIYSCQSGSGGAVKCVVFDLLPVRQTFAASTCKSNVGELPHVCACVCVCVGVCV